MTSTPDQPQVVPCGARPYTCCTLHDPGSAGRLLQALIACCSAPLLNPLPFPPTRLALVPLPQVFRGSAQADLNACGCIFSADLDPADRATVTAMQSVTCGVQVALGGVAVGTHVGLPVSALKMVSSLMIRSQDYGSR